MSYQLPKSQNMTGGALSCNPVTSEDGNWVYMFILSSGDAGARLWQLRRHKNQTWDEADRTLITGAAATELSLPISDDSHNFGSNGIAYAANGKTPRRIYHAINMHNGAGAGEGDLKMIRTSTTTGAIAFWEVPTLPGNLDEQTYPCFLQLPNGRLIYVARDGGISGNGDYILWYQDPGSDTWTRVPFLMGKDSATGGESAYPMFHVRPNGEILCAANWRTDTADNTANEELFFIRSKNGGTEWETLMGTKLTMPITRAVTQATPGCEVGINPIGPWINGGGVCWTPQGPVITISLNPAYHFLGNPVTGVWTQTQIGSGSGIIFGNYRCRTRFVPLWYKGKLAYLGVGTEGTSSSVGQERRFPYLWRMNSPTVLQSAIKVGGQVTFGETDGAFGGQFWDANYDMVAYRQGRISIATPQGDAPYTFELPNYKDLAYL